LLLGRAPYLAPLAIVLSAAFIGLLVGGGGRLLTAALEAAVPLAAGIFAASLVASEPSLELHLSTPGGFRPAGLRRIGLLLAWNAVVCLVTLSVASVAGGMAGWQPDGGPVLAQLTWLPSLVFFVAGGLLLGIGLRNRSAANTAVALFWVGCHFFRGEFRTWVWLPYLFPFMTSYEPHAADWLPTRLGLLAIAVAALALVAIWLAADEWLLSSEDR
jgi:hypothetical protein